MTADDRRRVAVGPIGAPEWLSAAVLDGGGLPVTADGATAMVWADARDAEGLAGALRESPGLAWVQLPFAGVEDVIPVIDDRRLWTCAKGVYAEPVAELAMALILAGLRRLGEYARAGSWTAARGSHLWDAEVVVIGGGGIAETVVRLLQPFRCRVTVVRRHRRPIPGAERVLAVDQLHAVLPAAAVVVLALSLTPETEGIIGAAELQLMRPNALLVNVSRGRHVVTDDLVDALRTGHVAAALDVVDPEPLPNNHPLWSMPNCLLTPHAGNTPAMSQTLLSRRITLNVRRWIGGEDPLGRIDPELGY